MSKNGIQDLSEELVIQPYKYGIKLVKPNKISNESRASVVSNIMKLPTNFYFMDRNSILKKVNEYTAKTCGYLSMKDAVGRSIRDVSKRETADLIIKNDREIISSEMFNISMESYTRLDDVMLTAISLKFPWLHDGKVIGIFGCSILTDDIGYQNFDLEIPPFIQKIVKQSRRLPRYHSGLKIGKVSLNIRETEIVYLIIRGYTAKTIGKKLGLSHRTIEHSVDRIKNKFSVSSKSELINKVIDHIMILKGI